MGLYPRDEEEGQEVPESNVIGSAGSRKRSPARWKSFHEHDGDAFMVCVVATGCDRATKADVPSTNFGFVVSFIAAASKRNSSELCGCSSDETIGARPAAIRPHSGLLR